MKLGKIYKVTFLDHTCFSGDEGAPVICEAIGRLTRISRLHLELTTWRVTRLGWENNNEGFGIVRSCIIKKKELK